MTPESSASTAVRGDGPAEVTPSENARGGVSAAGQAVLFADEIEAVESQILTLNEVLEALRAQQGRWDAGADGERRVVKVLVDLVDAGWRILPDRRWPGTSRANIDVLLVGPGGVFVIDVKNWSELRVANGRLYRGATPVGDADKLLAQVVAVEDVLSDIGLPPSEVVPVLVMAHRGGVRASLGRIDVLGERDLARYLMRRGIRLDAAQVDAVSRELERACPPMPPSPGPARVRGRHARRPIAGAANARRTANSRESQIQQPLIGRDEVWRELVEIAAREPIDAWMSWLHPMQAKLASRSWSGPARIRGATGTGKTVVALHRARHLARSTGQPVLFTSFVRTLPAVHRSLMMRMDPQAAELVEFRSLHAWARRLLVDRGIRVDVNSQRAGQCFRDAWKEARVAPILDGVGLPLDYWRDELAHVIKGRGLARADQYLELSRVGRRTALHRAQRQAVWTLFTAYERLLRQRGLLDWEDLLIQARDSVREHPVEPGYAAVVVDEVQDLSCVALELLHALVGDQPNGLLLVGDGQQSIYPGGFTLAEAGVNVTGRAVVLEQNYRNGREILQRALRVVADDDFDDLDELSLAGARPVEAVRPGGRVVEARADDQTGQEAALTASAYDAHRLHGARWTDMAVLCRSNAEVERWLGVLARHAVPAMRLRDYDGTPTDGVKVGTYQRAKGLEFAFVFVPDMDKVPRGQRIGESDDAYRERSALERRQLFVAMTRARDGLWIGQVRD